MPGSSWALTTLGTLCEQTGGTLQTGPFGSQLHAHDYEKDGEVPVVPTSAIGRRRLLDENVERIGRAKATELARHHLRPGDILFARRGAQATGLSALVEDRHDGWLCGTGAIRLRLNPTHTDPEFISFVLASEATNRWIRHHAIGATMPNLNESVIRGIPVYLPPLSEQRAVAALLGSLDARIELNRRMNKTLEELARTIFKSWFVDFDPVRANAERRHPAGMDAATAALFPNRLVESELGEVPEEWRAGTLGDLADLNPESWSRQSRPPSICYVDLSNTKCGRIEATTTLAWVDAPSRAQRILRPGDTIVGTVRPGNKSYALITEDGLTGSTGFAVLRPHAREAVQYAYLAATSQSTIETLARLADGGAYPAVRPEVVIGQRCIIPTVAVLTRFSSLTEALFARGTACETESKSLAELRDLLLPKLISGQLRVPTAEKMVEAAL